MEITTLRVDLISDLDITILRILLFLSFLFLQKLQFILDAISNTTTQFFIRPIPRHRLSNSVTHCKNLLVGQLIHDHTGAPSDYFLYNVCSEKQILPITLYHLRTAKIF